MVEPTAMFTFPLRAEVAPRMRRFVARWLADTDLTETDSAELLIAVSEAIANACRHASPPGHSVHIFCARSHDRVVVSITDDGNGFTPQPGALDEEPDLDQTDGRGLYVMRQFAHDVRITGTPRGTTVTLVRQTTPV